jgi:hypothetical protein
MTDIPCGRCDCGTYSASAIFNPASQAIAAGGSIPRCKTFDRPCVGDQDFKDAFDSATPGQRADILNGSPTQGNW